MSLSGLGAAICDVEQVIAVAGPAKKELLHKPLSPQLEELVQGKRHFAAAGENTVLAAQGLAAAAVAVYPVVSNGDPMGAVMLLKGEKSPARVSAEVLESARPPPCSSPGSWRCESRGPREEKTQKKP